MRADISLPHVAMFTDTYHPTVNGVTYTIDTWRHQWLQQGGQIDVVYPDAGSYTAASNEHPVSSVSLPFYDGFRAGLPQLPDAVQTPAPDVIHAQSSYSLGLAGLRLARQTDVPLVASYHTPISEYIDYVTSLPGVTTGLETAIEQYERWFYNHADLVFTPSQSTREYLMTDVGVTTPIRVLSNGIDTTMFRPVEEVSQFKQTHGLPADTTLVGYTGRHGHEKQLSDLIAAADTSSSEFELVLGGDGPARDALQAQAARAGIETHFLGFLDRDALPAFYSALDVFTFPSPVETEGLVALEAIACGTPVVGADAGALVGTIDHEETGYRYPAGDIDAFATRIDDALATKDALAETCLARREQYSVEATIDTLAETYRSLQ